mmetsp:Transcript_18211/g.43013  ORF Transcript_18211/g.43013 Transcript_18211/m.43013 type:complete len:205 (-) Transcript_18211:315-929(-)
MTSLVPLAGGLTTSFHFPSTKVFATSTHASQGQETPIFLKLVEILLQRRLPLQPLLQQPLPQMIVIKGVGTAIKHKAGLVAAAYVFLSPHRIPPNVVRQPHSQFFFPPCCFSLLVRHSFAMQIPIVATLNGTMFVALLLLPTAVAMAEMKVRVSCASTKISTICPHMKLSLGNLMGICFPLITKIPTGLPRVWQELTEPAFGLD